MKEEPPENGLKPVWKNQAREAANVSAEQIQERARSAMNRSRVRLALECFMTLVLSLVWGMVAYKSPDIFGHIGWGLAAVVVFCMFIVRLPALVKAWTAKLAPEAATRTCVDFQRRMLQARMSYERHAFLFAFPLLISIGILVMGPILRQIANNPAFVPPLRPFLPFCLLLVLWGISFIVKRRQMHRRWRDEIATLDAFEKDQT